MATNDSPRTSSELPGSEAASLASIAISAAWLKARNTYQCNGHTGTIARGTLYFSARLASGTTRLCRPCADRPWAVAQPADPFDFGGVA